ncbi:MAG: DegV family EDD domain-containing protein, partial [Anaerolineaceae bacterium]|nr:DegV family EDD domain-containing protein [Anaerolineaceae bacterium]
EAAKQGKSKEEILAVIEDILSRVHVYAALPTLKYLAMGGRMGKLTAGIAETLNIKPILTARDGKLELLEKVRTLKKAEARLIELACESAEGKEIESIALIHVNNVEGVKALFTKLQTVLHFESEPLIMEFTAGLSVHAGSGVIGYVLLTK